MIKLPLTPTLPYSVQYDHSGLNRLTMQLPRLFRVLRQPRFARYFGKAAVTYGLRISIRTSRACLTSSVRIGHQSRLRSDRRRRR